MDKNFIIHLEKHFSEFENLSIQILGFEVSTKSSLTYESGNLATAKFDYLLSLSAGEVLTNFYVEQKKMITPNRLGRIFQIAHSFPLPVLFVAEYISPSAKAEFINRKISFVELFGDMHIIAPGLYIDIRKNKSNRSVLDKISKSVKLTKKSKILIKGIIDNPAIVQNTYREIRENINVSLSVISKTFKDLLNHGYLIKNDSGFLVNDINALKDYYYEVAGEKRPMVTSMDIMKQYIEKETERKSRDNQKIIDMINASIKSTDK